MARFDPITTPTTEAVLTEANQINAISHLHGPFTLPELAASICRAMPKRYSTQAGRLAEAALVEWQRRGIIRISGQRDGMPLYRRGR